jgi:hypothetical protein
MKIRHLIEIPTDRVGVTAICVKSLRAFREIQQLQPAGAGRQPASAS